MYTRAWMVIAIPAGLSLTGFIFATFGNTYDLVSMFIIFQFFAVVAAPYLAIANLMYTAYLTQTNTGAVEKLTNWHTGKVVDATPEKSDPGFMRLIRKPAPTVPVMLNQVVSLPVYDYERNFARTLINMRNSNFEVDMTEKYWIKGGRFGESRETFVAMLAKWEYHGLSGRTGRQNKRVPLDWRKIRLVEQGNPLPDKPR